MYEEDVLENDFINFDYEDHFTVVIIYDIIENKRRNRLAKLLSGYGYRVQRSSFECLLSKEKFTELATKIEEFHKESDLIRIYKLNSSVKCEIYGEDPDKFEKEVIII
jgi:CRISPR-associated protein Cas2